jgi:gliding motility-associated-like protein
MEIRHFIVTFSIFLATFFPWIQNGIAQTPDHYPTIADFQIPDTVCTGSPVNIVNLTTGATSFFWKFCSGSTTQNPLGINLGDPHTLLDIPVFITLVKQGSQYHSFVANMGSGDLIRYDHGIDLMSSPPVGVSLGNFGMLSIDMRGIQIKQEGINWHGFIVNSNHLIRLDFGSSVTNGPTATDVGVYTELSEATGLVITRDGGNWYGFCTNFENSNFIRFSFGTLLTNTPVVTNLGSFGFLDHPFQFAMSYENAKWYALVCSSGSNTLARLEFGNSLSNVPSCISIGNPAAYEDNRGIVLSSDCGKVTGFVCQHTTNPDRLARLDFSNGVAGPITSVQIGNVGNMNRPCTFSELVHVGDTAYTFVVNMTNSTLTLLYFPDCNNASIPSSTLQNPPPVYYYLPGTYTIKLIVDEGLPTQATVCKTIVVVETPNVNLGSNKYLCAGTTLTLDAGDGYSEYLWSTGATTHDLSVTQPGQYWVNVTNPFDCHASDTVVVTEAFPDGSSVDTAVCFGQLYLAGGGWQNMSGDYFDSLATTKGCDSIVTTHLTIKPKILVELGHDSTICTGSHVELDGTTLRCTGYLWSDGSSDSILVVDEPGVYWVHVNVDNCMAGDTIRLGECPPKLWFPTAFTPNGDGLNDAFQPAGVSISRYHLFIYDRTGQMVFESTAVATGWNGTLGNGLCPPAVYTYIVKYETLDEPGVVKQGTGTFTLLR